MKKRMKTQEQLTLEELREYIVHAPDDEVIRVTFTEEEIGKGNREV
ncbi:MAG: hypothetical protein IJM50_04395 [Lachnospiraceae bacterium]|nr:hypothetical protein [Lachnospiraceae bacterium]